jgi:hypothetical protein
MVTELPENRKMSGKVSNDRNKQTTLLIPLTVHQRHAFFRYKYNKKNNIMHTKHILRLSIYTRSKS